MRRDPELTHLLYENSPTGKRTAGLVRNYAANLTKNTKTLKQCYFVEVRESDRGLPIDRLRELYPDKHGKDQQP